MYKPAKDLTNVRSFKLIIQKETKGHPHEWYMNHTAPNLHFSRRRLFHRLLFVKKHRLRRIAPTDRIVISDIPIKSSIRQIAAVKRQTISCRHRL